MKAITEMINQILMEWDPIGVGPELAIDEYQGLSLIHISEPTRH